MPEWFEKKQELVKAKSITRSLPKNFIESDKSLFDKVLKDNFHSVNIYFVKDVFILKDTLLKKFTFLDSFTHAHGLPLKSKIKRLLFFLRKAKKIEKAAWLTNDWSSAYFHWLIDVLPKLSIAEDFTKDRKLLLPARYKQFNYVTRSLDRLGVDYIYYDKTERIKVKELVIVDLMRYCDPQVMDDLRNKFISDSNPEQPPQRKIYISREKAPKRKITNEKQVTELMLSYGFEIHYFEEYELDEAVNIMKQCKYLVSIHGAGLTNMLFMKKGSKVLELRQYGDNLNGCYYSMANALNIDYYYLLCQSTPGAIQVADLTVNIEKLRKTLDQMLD